MMAVEERTVELFAGTCSFSSAAKAKGYKTFTTDNDDSFDVDLVKDVLKIHSSELPYRPHVLWASPPCETFSVASIGHHWTGGSRAYIPKTDKAITGQEYVKKTIKIIDQIKPKYWIIENPRGVLRKLPFMQGLKRYTVTYCQYGDTRMKPTDIWTNIPNWAPRPMCKNGDSCHVSAPRGSRTGTQGIKGAFERSKIPTALFEEIFQSNTSKGDK